MNQRHHALRQVSSMVNVSQQTLYQLLDMFQEIAQGRNSISRQQFVSVMRRHLQLPPQEANRLFTAFDTDGSGTLQMQEFMVGMAAMNGNSSVEQKLSFMFKLYDQDKSGSLDRNEIRQLLSALAQSGSGTSSSVGLEEMVDQFMNHVDANGDGVIDLLEFRKLVTDPVLANIRDQIVALMVQQFNATDAIQSVGVLSPGGNRHLSAGLDQAADLAMNQTMAGPYSVGDPLMGISHVSTPVSAAQMCRQWTGVPGSCRFGDQCRYSHSAGATGMF
eukprot:TRINITY_DN15286_c0_g1_i2.p1 TRINITY_DN15286_c0_g1~~TRINITY_DN15286_c0_g1_i2.p1  ORF type:complete len:275 (+),score=66.90 TRINITY_DN15286_c0_g1_i2:199-1023(+)